MTAAISNLESPIADPGLWSQARAEHLLAPDSPLSADARAVLRAMFDAGAIGPQRAVKQASLAADAGLCPRRLQKANLDLLTAGIVVCTLCGQAPIQNPKSKIQNSSGPGQFLARSDADVAGYREQLRRRAIQCFRHLQLLKRACRLASDAIAAERAGAGTLFAEAGARP
jgi:hypothetical protein